MSRFVSPDLSRLPTPAALEEVDYEALLEKRMADLRGRSIENGFNYDVGALETDPLKIDQETNAYFDTLVRGRVNDGIKAVMLATASGNMLDHIAASYYGISRLVVDDSDPDNIIWEKDDVFRARIALSVEAWSTAGPEGAYIFHGLEADGDVLDVVAYGEEDGAVYADGTPVLAPEILIVVASKSGNGLPTQTLLDKVSVDLGKEEVRPLGDKVTVEPVSVHEYRVEAVIKFKRGADKQLIEEEALKRVLAYVNARRRIGAVVQLLGLGGALKVTDVEEIALVEPLADIDPGSKGISFCRQIVITSQIAEDTWR